KSIVVRTLARRRIACAIFGSTRNSTRFEANPRRSACHPYHATPAALKAGRITRALKLSIVAVACLAVEDPLVVSVSRLVGFQSLSNNRQQWQTIFSRFCFGLADPTMPTHSASRLSRR